MKLIISISFILGCTIVAYGQGRTLIKSAEMIAPTEVSIDQAGNVYFSSEDGDIFRIGPSLEKREIFSPPNPATTNMLEAWQGLRIFTFHKEIQQYRLINRNLSLSEDYSFPAGLIGFAEAATPTFDNNIWVIDQADFSLKKYIIRSQRIASKTALDLILDMEDYEILHCREYQNRLFVSTQNKGILIFDNFGNLIKTLPYEAIGYFNFWKDVLYFIQGNKLIKINLYNNERLQTDLPEDRTWEFVLIFDQKNYLISGGHLFLYK
jgi:hypothetical protein